jgi:hypothetical protein
VGAAWNGQDRLAVYTADGDVSFLSSATGEVLATATAEVAAGLAPGVGTGVSPHAAETTTAGSPPSHDRAVFVDERTFAVVTASGVTGGVTGAAPATVQLFDAATGEALDRLTAHAIEVSDAAADQAPYILLATAGDQDDDGHVGDDGAGGNGRVRYFDPGSSWQPG